MSRPLTVMFAPINMVGPINASIGMAEVLTAAGHRVVFAVKSEWKGKLTALGYEEEIIGGENESTGKGPIECFVEEIESSMGSGNKLEKRKNLIKLYIEHATKELIEEDPLMEEIVQRVKPDVILIDNEFWFPSLMGSGIPWVLVMTCNPLTFDCVFDTKLPPSYLGLPTNTDPQELHGIRKELDDDVYGQWNNFNNWLISMGQPSLERCKFVRPSPYLNIYMFPEELDYTDIISWPSNFERFDHFKRSGVEEVFEIPEELRTKSGKLIFLSMGSICSGNVPLMKRLVAILSKSKHRFIVSKGAYGDRYELADNMWGENYVPQIKILPTVDLVITHGGNNTFTETLYFGKPVVVLPMFFDEFDNAQRIAEKEFGIQLDPFECTESELLDAIDNVLNDSALLDRVSKASQRIRSEENINKITTLLENIVKNN